MRLPPPLYYSIPELVEHWKKDDEQCTEQRILTYIETRKLLPSFRLIDIECLIVQRDSTGHYNGDDSVRGIYTGPVTLCHTTSDLFWSLYHHITNDWEVDLSGQIFNDDLGNLVTPLETVTVRKDDIVIMRKEALGFEIDFCKTPEPAPTGGGTDGGESAITATGDDSSEVLDDPATVYLKSHPDAPDGEKGAWLQSELRMTLNQIADILEIPGRELDYNGNKSKSRKNTMGKIIRDWKNLQCKNSG